MKNMDIFIIMTIANDIDATINFLKGFNVLKDNFYCICGKKMNMIKRSSVIDQYEYRCPKKCSRHSIRKNSFFSKSKLPLNKLLLLSYFWLQDLPVKNIQSMLNLSKPTMTDWCNFCSEVCSTILLRTPIEDLQIGGDNKIVEIDETVISKRQKYHRGKYYPEIWMFCGIERESNLWFAEIVPDRKRDTLLNIIKKYIKPGTIIYSDQWPGYLTENFDLSNLEHYNFVHYIFVHSLLEAFLSAVSQIY